MTTLVSTTAGLTQALASARSGDVIQLAAGNYAAVNFSNINISGGVTITSAVSGHNAVITGMNVSNSSGITFTNLDFSTVGATSTTDINQFFIAQSQNIVLDHVNVHGSQTGTLATDVSGFSIRDDTNLTISNSTFDHLHYAIAHLNDQHLTISNDTFTHIWDDGIRGSGSSYVNILDNNFSSFHADATDTDHPDCIQFWTAGATSLAHDITIAGNTYSRGSGNAVQGVFIEDDVGNRPYQNVTVVNNTFFGSLWNGITLNDVQSGTVADNALIGYPDYTPWVRFITSNNVLVGANRASSYLTTEKNGFLELIANTASAPIAVSTDASVAAINSLFDTYVNRDPSAAELIAAEAGIVGGGTLAALRTALLTGSEGVAFTAVAVTSIYNTLDGRNPATAEMTAAKSLIAGGADYAVLRQQLLASAEGKASTTSSLTALYDAYGGRDPTAQELAGWQALLGSLGSQAYTPADEKNALLNSALGEANTTQQINLLYGTYFGRSPQASELAIWQALILGGSAIGVLRTALVGDVAGQAHTTAQTTTLYDTYLARDPTASELTASQGSITGGADFTTLRTALLGDPNGQAHTNAQITGLYDTYFGRDPNASEFAAWQGLIAAGLDFNDMRTALLADPTGQAHTNAQITALYDTYFGRDPQPSELAAWQATIAGGVDFAGLRAILLNDPSGQAYTNLRVTALYDTYFGRDPSASELVVWQGLIAAGADLSLLRTILVGDPSGQAHTNSQIQAAYDTIFGRDPRVSEIAAWQGLILGGSDFNSLRAALFQDAGGALHINAQITALYDTYFGRDPSASELTTWQGLIVAGADFSGLRAALVGDSGGVAHTNLQTTLLYDSYFGRDPSASELSIWRGLIAGGADFSLLRNALIADAAGRAYIATHITALYDTYFGRDPQASEVSAWQGLIAGGADFNVLRAALLNDSSGRTYANSQITALYDTFVGRDPTATERAAAQNLINGGADFNGLRATLLGSANGAAHTASQTTLLYDTYFGRDPTATELTTWQGLIAGGLDFSSLRSALVNDSTGQAHTAAQTTALYDTYFGRDPTASELSAWKGLIGAGDDFSVLRKVLVTDQAGLAHIAAQTTTLFDAYAGRDPTVSEITLWRGLVLGGDDFYQLQDTLERVNTAAVFPHASIVSGIQAFAPGSTAAFLTVDTFNPAVDVLKLSLVKFSGVNPLDSAHARQITALDGTTDVLITLDAGHSILFEHTLLSSLHASDFLFA